jgi:hypothetical protein
VAADEAMMLAPVNRSSRCVATPLLLAVIPAFIILACMPAISATRCPGAIFAPGQMLPEPSGSPRVVTVFHLRRVSADSSRPLRLGYAYLATDGASYYQAETGAVAARDRDAEIALLRAAGFSKLLAQQYTQLVELPAIPPVKGLLALVAHLGGIARRCAP